MFSSTNIIKTIGPLDYRAWTGILLVQAVLGLSLVFFESPAVLILGVGMIALIPALYVWPLLGFAIILLTVPSLGTIMQIGKLDLRPNDLGILVGVLAVSIRWFKRRKITIDITKHDIPILLIVGWVFLSVLWTPSTGLGLFQAIKILFATFIYFSMTHLIQDEKELHNALTIWFLVSVLWGIMGTYTFVFHSVPEVEFKGEIISGTLPHLGKTVRTSSIFLDPNDYGFVLSICIMISILFFFRAEEPNVRIWSGLSIMMMIIVIVGTLSRKSWIGLAMSVFLVGLKKRKAFIASMALSFAAIAFMLTVGAGKWTDALINRIESFFLDPEIAITERAVAWVIAKDLFLNQPILGNGIGSFFILGPKHGSPLNIPHSFFWFIVMEFGLVGIFLFGLFVWTNFKGLMKIFVNSVDPKKRLYCIIFLATIPSVLFQSYFKTIGYTEPIFWVFWGFITVFVKIHDVPGEGRSTSS